MQSWTHVTCYNTTLCKKTTTLSYSRRVFVPSLSVGDYCCYIRSSPGRTERCSPRCWPLCTPEGPATCSPLVVALEVAAGLKQKEVQERASVKNVCYIMA